MTMKRMLKIAAAGVMLTAVTLGFFHPFYGESLPGARFLDWAVRIQPAATWAFLAVLVVTPLLGRFFCETCCPLGIIQSIVRFLFHPRTVVRRVCTRLPETKAQRVVRGTFLVSAVGLAAGGFGGLGWLLTPYAIYGKALLLSIPGLALFAAVLASTFFGKGRIWCNWVCPIGTLFAFLSKRSVCAHKIGSGCAQCQACFAKRAVAHETTAEAAVTRREALQGAVALAAVEAVDKTTDGGYAPVALPGVPTRTLPVLPPGALPRAAFNLKCVACGRCIQACRGGCLVPATALARLGQPEMDFRKGFCLTGCESACAHACPTGALDASLHLPRKDVHMGYAVWTKDRCIRITDGVSCTACARKCPVQAIHLVDGIPVVDRETCIGCGACEHVCPARPLPAIVVMGLERARLVRPMQAADLEAERAACRARGLDAAAVRIERTLSEMKG